MRHQCDTKAQNGLNFQALNLSETPEKPRIAIPKNKSRRPDERQTDSGYWHPSNYIPAYDWSQAGPIVSNEWFGIEDMLVDWFGPEWTRIKDVVEHPLKWFMRAYVATQYGNEVEDVHIVKSLGPDRAFLESPQKGAGRLHWTQE